MNDTPWIPGSAASAAATPTPYLPGSLELPGPLVPDGEYPGPVVLLLNASEHTGWAAETAVAIAANWASAGRRVVLADLHLEEPSLHELLGEENSDGIVDIFLYGASVARTARPPSGHRFYLIPAGTYTARPEDVYRHPRWNKLAAGFRDATATLLLFAPLGSPGVESLVEWSGSTILLGRGRDDGNLPVSESSLLAVLVRPGESTAPLVVEKVDETLPEPTSTMAERERADAGSADAGVDDTFASGAGTGSEELGDEAIVQSVDAGSDAGEAAFAEPDERPMAQVEPFEAPAAVDSSAPASTASQVTPAGGPPRRRRRHSGPGPLIWLLVGAGLLVGMVIAAVLVRPELFRGLIGAPAGGQADTTAFDVPSPLPPPPPRAVGDTLAFVVQVRAYRSLAAARGELPELQQRFPDEPFYIVPELTQGVLYYKVMAGILPDTTSALALRARLVDAGVISPADAQSDGPRNWSLIQTRPLAFYIAELDSRAEARIRADSLAERGIPTYPASIPYSDGSERWRLYGGAYADPAHAEEMRQLLVQAELPALLVPRVSRARTTDP